MIGLLIHKNHGDINKILEDSRNIFKETYLLDNFKYEDKTILLIFEKDIKNIDISKFDFIENVFHKQYTEYLDIAQCTSRFGFHTDHYVAPQRTGDKTADKKAIQDIDSAYALEDIAVILEETPIPINREIYVSEIEKIKKALKKNMEDMSFEELIKAYDLSKDHREIISIATHVYTLKYGRPVSKAGYEYNYKPEQFWSESNFGKPEFHVLHDMEYYFNEFPHMQKQWIKSLKTRCRNIIREELGLFRITGFIQFLRNKYVEEEMSEVTYYSKKEDSAADDIIPSKMNEMDFEIENDEIPF